MRLAFFSPLPPTRSGIAAYSAELLPAIARIADLDAFVADDSPTLTSIGDDAARAFRVQPSSEFTGVGQAGYDVAIYQMGNHPYHDFVLDWLLRYPGVTVLHEPFLHHLIVARTVGRGDNGGYLREMAYALGVDGIGLAREALRNSHSFPYFEHPLCERVIDSSNGVITHSQFAASIVRRVRPSARVAVVRQHVVSRDVSSARVAESRRSLGVPDGGLLLASFGMATAEKRLDLALRAFSDVRSSHPAAVFAIVGEASSTLGLAELAADLGIGDAVRVTGYVSDVDLLAYVAAADVGVCLRWPTLGETSGVLLRLLNAGRPAIVFDVGAFSEFPDDCVVKIAVDGTEQESLAEAMLELAGDHAGREALGARARAHVLANHSLEQSAAGYLSFINELLGRRPSRTEVPER